MTEKKDSNHVSPVYYPDDIPVLVGKIKETKETESFQTQPSVDFSILLNHFCPLDGFSNLFMRVSCRDFFSAPLSNEDLFRDLKIYQVL